MPHPIDRSIIVMKYPKQRYKKLLLPGFDCMVPMAYAGIVAFININAEVLQCEIDTDKQKRHLPYAHIVQSQK